MHRLCGRLIYGDSSWVRLSLWTALFIRIQSITQPQGMEVLVSASLPINTGSQNLSISPSAFGPDDE